VRYLSTFLQLAPAVLLSTAAFAADVGPCGELNRIDNLVGQVRAFSEGRIRVAHVDTGGEAVCCAAHLLVFIPGSEPGITQCFAVSDQAVRDSEIGRGFYSIDLSRVVSSYDPQRGLLLTVPYALYDIPKGGAGKRATARVRIDLRGDGSVTIER
jgi:hypothetical protein